ncbi:hypothetical protein GCM10023322_20640 [Rugosimonospora acidiphila]|uniref:Uncharacterized protein n=1 Tax=Rugosimonospora acidiphila TaxID=556531 RepID=A0ABP9RPW8_9ACTN
MVEPEPTYPAPYGGTPFDGAPFDGTQPYSEPWAPTVPVTGSPAGPPPPVGPQSTAALPTEPLSAPPFSTAPFSTPPFSGAPPQPTVPQPAVPQTTVPQTTVPQTTVPPTPVSGPGYPPTVTYPYPGLAPAQPAYGANEPTVMQIGEIQITATTVRTPAGVFPLRGSQWTVTDQWMTEQKIPTWAIVLAIVLFFCVTVFSLLFLLARETRHHAVVQVHVVNGPYQYVARIPASDQGQVQYVYQQVNYVRSLAAA